MANHCKLLVFESKILFLEMIRVTGIQSLMAHEERDPIWVFSGLKCYYQLIIFPELILKILCVNGSCPTRSPWPGQPPICDLIN